MAETVGDIMITIAVEDSQAQKEMEKFKQSTKEAVTESKRLVNSGSSIGRSLATVKSHFASTGDSIRQLAQSTGILGNGFTMLKGALSGIIGMVGFGLASALAESTRASINARGNIDSFSKRLQMSQTEVSAFSEELKKLQQEFRKVDMQQVGATALELANKLDVPKNKIADLTKTTAVMSSAFTREGRSSQDAILAVSDALDGQFKRLQEIGITQDILKNNGWNGNLEDTANLIDALNASMDQLGITETARQVTNLDDAWAVLNVAMSQLLTEIIVPLTPLIAGVVLAFADLANAVTNWWASMPDGARIALITAALTALSYVIISYVISSFVALQAEVAALEIELIPLIATILAVAAVVAVVTLAIFEVGKALGWWTDGASAMQVVGDALRGVFNNISECLRTVYNGFMQVASPALTAFWKSFTQMVQPLGDALMNVYNSLMNVGDAFGGASGSGRLFADIGRVLGVVFTDALKRIELALGVIIPVITHVINVFGLLVNFVGQVGKSISDVLQGNISWTEFGEQIGTALRTMISGIQESLLTTLGQIWDNLTNSAREGLSKLPEVASEELGNIAQALSDPGAILAAITALGEAVVGFFKGVLGIASPGYMAQSVQEEMGHIAEFISGAVGMIVGAIIDLAMNIVNGFVNALIGLPAQISAFLGQMVLAIQLRFNQARNIASLLVNAIRNAIVTRFNLIVARVRAIFTNIVSTIRGRLLQAFTSAGQLASRIRQVIQQRLQAVVNKVRGIFTQIVSEIRSRLSNAVNTAREKAMEIYNNIKNKISEIPQIVADEFSKIPGKITSALASAASAAASGARDIVSRFASALGINSPGFVQRMTEAEFKSLPAHIRDSGIEAVYQTQNMARNIVNAWERNMDTMTIPIEQFDAFNPALAVDSMLSSENVALLRTDLSTSRAGGIGGASVRSTSNNNVTHDNSSVVYEIQNINLEMGNLTKEQSRRVLYEALDGLYTGGV